MKRNKLFLTLVALLIGMVGMAVDIGPPCGDDYESCIQADEQTGYAIVVDQVSITAIDVDYITCSVATMPEPTDSGSKYLNVEKFQIAESTGKAVYGYLCYETLNPSQLKFLIRDNQELNRICNTSKTIQSGVISTSNGGIGV